MTTPNFIIFRKGRPPKESYNGYDVFSVRDVYIYGTHGNNWFVIDDDGNWLDKDEEDVPPEHRATLLLLS